MPKPSLLGLLASVRASKQSPEDMAADDDARSSKPDERPGVEAARSFLDACDDDDPGALADALGAFLDMRAGEAPAPKDDTKPAGTKPALTIHLHTT